jgi:hypothetical protein
MPAAPHCGNRCGNYEAASRPASPPIARQPGRAPTRKARPRPPREVRRPVFCTADSACGHSSLLPGPRVGSGSRHTWQRGPGLQSIPQARARRLISCNAGSARGVHLPDASVRRPGLPRTPFQRSGRQDIRRRPAFQRPRHEGGRVVVNDPRRPMWFVCSTSL